SELLKVNFILQYFQYMIDIRIGQKIIVPDDLMRQFIAVAGTYDEHIIFFSPDEVYLRKGTKVRITGGDFE
ncbi:transcriptional regulator, partial [Phocaeicola vulgatus]|nr:transcriptional regulator [Phocaeicola vulgatus]